MPKLTLFNQFQLSMAKSKGINVNGNFSFTSTEWPFIHCFQVEFEVRNVFIFVEGGKPE